MRFKLKDIYYGLCNMLVGFTSIVIVTQIAGFNLRNAFLMMGFSTILFNFITKHKVCGVMGCSGSYLAGVITLSQLTDKSHVFGGIVIAGLIYILFGLAMLKYQDVIIKYLPDWLLATTVVLISLMLLPIGKSMISGNLYFGLLTLILLMFFNHVKHVKTFAIPLSIFVSTVLYYIFNPTNLEITKSSYSFILPSFDLQSLSLVGLVAIPVLFEMMGDIKTLSIAQTKDLFKEIGVGRIAIGNGFSTILSGFGNSLPATTYSENASFVMLSNYKRPQAQIFTGVFFVLISLFSPLISVIQFIPTFVFGGVAIYLYSLIFSNAIKRIEFDNTNTAIITIMTSLFFIDYTFMGLTFSSIAVSVIVGIVLNILNRRKLCK